MSDTLLEFPCDFPIKVMGTQTGTLRSAVKLAADDLGVETISLSERPSRTGKYTAVTLTVSAQSQQQLDALYQRLTALDDVKMVL